MASVETVFRNLENAIKRDGQSDFALLLQRSDEESKHVQILKKLLASIFKEIDRLVSILKKDSKILLSVKHQKLLRASFQLITSLGIAPCLLPGVGVSLSRRCSSAVVLPCITLNDEEKYELLVLGTEFFTRSYTVPVLRTIIITFHLCDYLASLIQLSFAPLKKPGSYKNFTMTVERHTELSNDRKRFVTIYENLVTNCFQPTLMKELLILTGAREPSPPQFVVRVIAKEMSRRLLAPGGLLSLMRCFLESHELSPSNNEWIKSDMICKLVTFKHGNVSDEDYFSNICSQLTQILTLSNTHYLAEAVACAVSLHNKYPQLLPVKEMSTDMFQAFDYGTLATKGNLLGTLLLSPQEVENKINILDSCVSRNELSFVVIQKNIPILVEIAIKLEKSNDNMMKKIKHIILKCLEKCDPPETFVLIKKIMFGERKNYPNILIEEYEAGIALKYKECTEEYPITAAMSFILQIFRSSDDGGFTLRVFDSFLQIFNELTEKKTTKHNQGLLASEDVLLLHTQYAYTLEVLFDISTEHKVLNQLKKDATPVFNFIEKFLVKYSTNAEVDCLAICVILLKTLLPVATKEIKNRCNIFIPVLEKVAKDNTNEYAPLFKEVLNEINCDRKSKTESAYEKAVSDVFDSCLPVRAHGIMHLTKLIDAKDPETLSKKHYLFCLFQEQLKDPDSYIYLSAVNGLAALGLHCTEDVLNELCKEFLDMSPKRVDVQTKDDQNAVAELRMKIGDVIVKVTKGLGEMAVVHKTKLLNTMLCACRDDDPLIRASALSNLAEVARVLNYKMGTIIYEVLLLIWNTIKSDKAIECRRAAVMVIGSLLKGLGSETLFELKEQLLPIYRTLKKLYIDEKEDDIVRLHSQVALEELNTTTRELVFPDTKIDKKIFVLD